MGSLPRLRPRFEVAQVLRDQAADYRARRAMTEEQQRTVWAMVHCRTGALGAHVVKQVDRALPVPYSHLVFKLPAVQSTVPAESGARALRAQALPGLG